ncbi:MAG: hypothetical protein LBF05_03595 [Tannerella sp.]|jgi:hypothetical protein|nr:hypothetical protein [Tannerella sp.]
MAPIMFAGAKIGIISYAANLFEKSTQKNHFFTPYEKKTEKQFLFNP